MPTWDWMLTVSAGFLLIQLGQWMLHAFESKRTLGCTTRKKSTL